MKLIKLLLKKIFRHKFSIYIRNLIGVRPPIFLLSLDKKNISNCYNVKNGLYSSTEAKTIFNHFFSGDKCLRGLV